MEYQTDNQVRIETLHKLLNQLSKLNVDEDSREKLAEALQAALRALRSEEQGGVELTQKSPAMDHLLRLATGQPTAKEESNRDAVMHLAALVNNEDQDGDQGGSGGAVDQLSELVRKFD